MDLWEEIMQKCPTMKQLVENKINEEISKKDIEILALKEQNKILIDAIDKLILDGLGSGQ